MRKVFKLTAAEVACVLKEHFGVFQNVDITFTLHPQNGAVGPIFSGAEVSIEEGLPLSKNNGGV